MSVWRIYLCESSYFTSRSNFEEELSVHFKISYLFTNHRPSNKRMGVSEWKSVLLWHYLLLNFIEKWSLGWLMTYSDLQNNICKALTHSPEHLNGVWDTFHYDVWPFYCLVTSLSPLLGSIQLARHGNNLDLGLSRFFYALMGHSMIVFLALNPQYGLKWVC